MCWKRGRNVASPREEVRRSAEGGTKGQKESGMMPGGRAGLQHPELCDVGQKRRAGVQGQRVHLKGLLELENRLV